MPRPPLVLAALASLLCALPSSGLAAPPPVPAEDAAAMLALLADAGRISRADADRLIRTYALARTPRSVPRQKRCGTPTFLAMRSWLGREGVRLLNGPLPPIGSVDGTTYPVRVYYSSLSEKTKAQEAVRYAEESWRRQIVERGHHAPFTSGDDDSVVPGMRFYFTSSDSYAGLTIPGADVPSTPRCDCSAIVYLESSLWGNDLASTIEHEFNHTTQAATDCAEAISAWENFAEAAEIVAYNEPWMSRYIIQAFQDWPDYPLDYWTQSEGSTGPTAYYQYGAALFPFFLRDRFGGGDAKFFPVVWDSFAQDGTIVVDIAGPSCSAGNVPDWFDGLDTLLRTKGSSLKDAFTEFSQWRAIVGAYADSAHLRNAGSYPAPRVGFTLSRFPVERWLEVREYATQYVEYTPSGDEGALKVTITGKTETTWSGAVLLWRQGKPVESLPLAFDDQAIATLTTPPLAGIWRVLIVVNQLQDASHEPDEMDYASGRFFKFRVEQQAGPDAGAPPGPDATAPGPDAPAGPDAGGAQPDAGEADAGTGPQAEGCGCASSTNLAPLGLGLLALVLPRRRREPLSRT